MRTGRLAGVVIAAVAAVFAFVAPAAAWDGVVHTGGDLPTCSSTDNDPDRDGYGWEGNRPDGYSCAVYSSGGVTKSDAGGDPGIGGDSSSPGTSGPGGDGPGGSYAGAAAWAEAEESGVVGSSEVVTPDPSNPTVGTVSGSVSYANGASGTFTGPVSVTVDGRVGAYLGPLSFTISPTDQPPATFNLDPTAILGPPPPPPEPVRPMPPPPPPPPPHPPRVDVVFVPDGEPTPAPAPTPAPEQDCCEFDGELGPADADSENPGPSSPGSDASDSHDGGELGGPAEGDAPGGGPGGGPGGDDGDFGGSDEGGEL